MVLSEHQQSPKTEGASLVRSIAASYRPAEWWCDHLCNVLSENVKVERFPQASGGQSGYSWTDDLAKLLRDFDPGSSLYFGSREMLFSELPNLKYATAIYYDYFPHDMEGFWAAFLFDFVFVTSKKGLNHLASAGHRNVHWLPHGFDASLEYNQTLERIYDVGFVGTTILKTHAKRRALLTALARRYKMNDYTQPVFRNDLYRVYNQSKIVVNIPHLGGFNMRNFEAMACGALLMTEDLGSDQADLFQNGHHLVTYSSTEDLFGKIDFYLRNSDARQHIAGEGQKEVIAKHSYQHRARAFLRVVQANPSARGRSEDANIISRAYSSFYHRNHRLDLLLRLMRSPQNNLGTRFRICARFLRCFIAQLCRPAVP